MQCNGREEVEEGDWLREEVVVNETGSSGGWGFGGDWDGVHEPEEENELWLQ